MTTLDELVKVYDAAYENRARLEFPTPEMKQAMHRAGIAAVVRALRHKFTEAFILGARNGLLMSDSDLTDYSEKWIASLVDGEILGDAGDEAGAMYGATSVAVREPGQSYCQYCGKPVRFKETP